MKIITIAASNSKNKKKCDYICKGKNDQDVINVAIKKLGNKGGQILLRAGTYHVYKNKVGNLYGGIMIENQRNVHIKGEGYDTRLIQANNQSTNVIRGFGSNTANIKISDLFIDGNSQKNPRKKSHNGRFESNGIRISAGTGFNTKPIKNIVVERCQITNCPHLGIMVNGVKITVRQNLVGNCISDCIEVLGRDAIVVDNEINVTTTAHVGIGTDKCDDVIIANNEIICNKGAKLGIGIRTWPQTKNTFIFNNKILCKGGTIKKGFRILGDFAVIQQNKVWAEGGKIIEIRVRGHSVYFINNSFEDCGNFHIQSNTPHKGKVYLQGNTLKRVTYKIGTNNVIEVTENSRRHKKINTWGEQVQDD